MNALSSIRAASSLAGISQIAVGNSALWDSAVADYRAKRAASDAMPLGTEGEDEAVDAYCTPMDHLINDLPAPDVAAVVTKLELAFERCEEYSFSDDYQRAILSDLRRLAPADTPRATA